MEKIVLYDVDIERAFRELSRINSSVDSVLNIKEMDISEYGKSLLLQLFNQSIRFSHIYNQITKSHI
jgi:hypothetical protein